MNEPVVALPSLSKTKRYKLLYYYLLKDELKGKQPLVYGNRE